jgi:hypothetical protein
LVGFAAANSPFAGGVASSRGLAGSASDLSRVSVIDAESTPESTVWDPPVAVTPAGGPFGEQPNANPSSNAEATHAVRQLIVGGIFIGVLPSGQGQRSKGSQDFNKWRCDEQADKNNGDDRGATVSRSDSIPRHCLKRRLIDPDEPANSVAGKNIHQ